MRRAAALLVTFAHCCRAAPLPPDDDDLVVELPSLGKLRGTLASQGADYIFRAFKGVPFAEPPVSERRFQPPVPKKPWRPATLSALQFKSECTQRWPRIKYPTGAWDDVEDCLYLNIYTPRRNTSRPPPKEGFPVWFYVHGGAYETGSAIADGTGALFDPHWMYGAGFDDVVVVTTQYRLGAFGFLGGSEMKLHTSDGSAGNFGLQDQRLAMRWTREYISHFGGNPNQLMLFGESSGGTSVAVHLVAERSFGLYERAAMESGNFFNWAYVPAKRADQMYNKMLKRVRWNNETTGVTHRCSEAATSIKRLTCLRTAPLEAIARAADSATAPDDDTWDSSQWGPVVDGVELLHSPAVLLAKGVVSNVPVIIGSNSNEGSGRVICSQSSLDS